MTNVSISDIKQIKSFGTFSDLDISFAHFIHRISDKKPPELFWSTLLLSYVSSSEGHVCLDLEFVNCLFPQENEIKKKPALPPAEKLSKILTQCSVVGIPGEFCPLILDGLLLYLHKFWHYENGISEKLNALSEKTIETSDPDCLLKLLDTYFPQEKKEINWQRIAAFVAATRQLCITTGGPGTGKTTAVIQIIVLLLELEKEKKLRVAVAAPTGKAAARLDETLNIIKDSLKHFKDIHETMPASASTIHRLLGAIPRSQSFRYNEENPLPFDIVVIDEASMIDLSLMAKLLKALPDHCRLILLGDRDQLASVEAGSVFGDICHSAYLSVFSKSFGDDLLPFTVTNLPNDTIKKTIPDIADCMVELKKVYRFKGSLAECSNAVKKGEGENAFSIIAGSDPEAIQWKELTNGIQISDTIKEDILQGWQVFLEADTIEKMFSAFTRFRMLCVLRSGPFGVENINRIIENILSKEGAISPATKWYTKKPVMITKNDYQMNLYNGDTGIVAPDPQDEGKLKAWFPPLTKDNKTDFRPFSPSRLPENETAYAITVHKSQGNEFNSVMLLLPDKDTPLLTRELLYTGITRAREKVILYGKEDIFKAAVNRGIERRSGLREKLWKGKV